MVGRVKLGIGGAWLGVDVFQVGSSVACSYPGMKLNRLLYTVKHALRTEKGRQVAGRLTDTAADTARRASPRHQGKIDKAQQSARKYLDRR